MTFCQISLLVFLFTLFSSTAFAGKKDAEAASMIERAKQHSNIRAEGAPGFRLKLIFKAFKEDGSGLEGTYTEVWSSKTQWRKEIVVGDFHRTEVAAGQNRWILDSGKAFSERVGELPALTDIDRIRPETWRAEKIENRKLKGSTLRCVETEPEVPLGVYTTTSGSSGGVSALCFDTSSQWLVAEIQPVQAVNQFADSSCFFSDYQKFGDREFPRTYQCLEGGYPRLEARVVELAAEPKPDAELFAQPNGAKESTGCPDAIRPPRIVHQANLDAPASRGVVTITMFVGIDGIPHGLNVVWSPDAKLEKAALEDVRQWRYRPASCDGEPVEAKIQIQVNNVR